MSESEIRWPCPVCLGTRLKKLRLGAGAGVVVDACPRCRGVWFEAGEIEAVEESHRTALLSGLGPSETPHRMRCRGCDGMVDRDRPSCPTCGWEVRIRCPSCDRPMDTLTTPAGIRLDACRQCRGAWFDAHELRHVWRLGARVARARENAKPTRLRDGAAVAADATFEMLIWAPDLPFAAARAAGQAMGAAPELAAGAAEAAGGLAAGAGEIAAAAFELILEAIASIF